jgi:hypothetical protein
MAVKTRLRRVGDSESLDRTEPQGAAALVPQMNNVVPEKGPRLQSVFREYPIDYGKGRPGSPGLTHCKGAAG